MNTDFYFTSVSKKVYFLLGFFFVLNAMMYGQNQKLADSLETVYSNKTYRPENELRILEKLAYVHPDPNKALEYSEILLQKAQAVDSTELVISAYLQKGNALTLKGDVSAALGSYLNGVKLASDEGQNRELGLLYTAIAGVYSVMGNRENTIFYYKNAIAILEKEKDNDPLNYASVLENLGDEYNLNFAQPDSALLFFKQSGAIFKELGHKPGMAYNLGNIGLAYAQKGENSIAEKNIVQAMEMLKELGDYYPICVYLTYMSDIYADQGNLDAAFTYAQRSLELGQQYGLKDQISDANLALSELYERQGDNAASLAYYKSHIAYKDSVRNITLAQQMADQRADFEISQKQIEVDLLNQQKENQQIIAIATTIALFLIALLAFGLYRRNRFIKRTNQIIRKEKDRSDTLLLNILPEETAIELKEKGRVQAKKFESVTVLFTDFKGFTSFAENLPPEELVKSVDFYFSRFDKIIEKHGLEKIKTVGDSYMCAGGLPFPDKNHAFNAVRAAFEINEFVEQAKERTGNGTSFEVRVGINTGPVVAGVVGTKKFAYDIWGDTVNVASRMETMSKPGRINISESTYDLIKNHFNCEPRGEIYVKNRGMMQMYFVNGTKAASTSVTAMHL
ncbi:adenylate/guanylate cyclase domain-containing protein [Flavobacteriaceae bacterium TP-CH-4]|uniref:Adenylate cyclase n=1 Tax=Pelagihabitans pacificus TaxID=2696054 RepID=A0A967ATX0_9FLAO|nr:adenylate/guanylate cyclase domain-containing protein [Pelagihabitans pacificus]NHF59934.1 adenylate/guanylate cyclase domain-containing protein [Pelagihabitans pacificus]